MSTNASTSETLNRAADLIEKRGWVHGVAGWPHGSADAPLCLEGGIMAALGGVYVEDDDLRSLIACPAYRAVSGYLELSDEVDETGWPIAMLWNWNDNAERTPAEVIEVLRATAVIEAAREESRVEVPA